MTVTRLRRKAPVSLTSLVNAIGSSRITGIWHRSMTVKSGSNFVSLDDARGGGNGFQLVPNGGLGGTAPTVAVDGTIVTDGIGSFIANAAATAKCPLSNNAFTFIFWGEMTGAGPWGGVVDSLTAPTQKFSITSNGASGWKVMPAGTSVAKVQPGAGVRSLFIVSWNNPYLWQQNANLGVCQRFEVVGRGPSMSVPVNNISSGGVRTDPNFTPANAFMCLGRDGGSYGVVKFCGGILLNSALTYADRVAIEQFVTDPRIGDNVSLYAAADSTGLAVITGDSLSVGSHGDPKAYNTPADPTTTTPAGKFQNLANAASKPIDVAPWGVGATHIQNHTTAFQTALSSYYEDIAAFYSPARRAAGFKEMHINWGGGNDIDQPAPGFGLTDLQVRTYVLRALQIVHAAGAKFVQVTIIPRSTYFGNVKDTYRKALNTWDIANSVGADAVVNLTAVTGGIFADPGGSDTITTNAAIFFVDGVHLIGAGYTPVGTEMYNDVVAAGLL